MGITKKQFEAGPSEDWECMQLHDILSKHTDLFYLHIPNGGKRTAREANKFRMMGTMKGYPDYEFPFDDYYVEMKRAKGGVLSKEQENIIEVLRSRGKTVDVCHGYVQAIESIAKRFDLDAKALLDKAPSKQ